MLEKRRSNVRSWLQGDMQPPEYEVCFTPNTGHSEAHAGLPLLTHNGLWDSMDSSISRPYNLAHRVLR